MNIDPETLLDPVSADNPVGDNLEYDPAFLELERTSQPKPEQQVGGAIVPGEAPDHRAMLEQAVALFARTKDLRVANVLAHGLLYSDGFLGISRGLGIARGLTEKYWDSVHPQLEDDNDPTMRVTALAGLSTPDVVTRLRNSMLISSRSFGPIGLRELAIANGELPQSEDGPKYDPNSVEAAFLEVELEELQQVVDALEQATEHLKGLDAVFEANAPGGGPDFTPLRKVLHQATVAARPRLQARLAALAEAEAEAAAAEQAGTAEGGGPSGRLSGEISSREDVLRALDKLCAYYTRHEPSSPLPLLLHRCKRLVPMSFKEIVSDLAPDALSKVELIAGKEE
jgi:type VI secretion system protein ImpA